MEASLEAHNSIYDALVRRSGNINLTENEIAADGFFDDALKSALTNYTRCDYARDVEKLGLDNVWKTICAFAEKFGEVKSGLLNVDHFGELYEIGLSIQNKDSKKSNGQYFTPADVADVMAEWFNALSAENICDVGCGTGSLILSCLNSMEKQKALSLLLDGKIFLYDSDMTALKICRASITVKYGKEAAKNARLICGDFLDARVRLPENCKVISNPPYAKISKISDLWERTDVLVQSGELYAAFAEKIFRQSKRSVIITPYSFIGGDKFYLLRRVLNDLNGFIVSFDNVPGNIFNGKKHGVFNTNTSNSVRAAITVVQNEEGKRGFKLSPLIRFKNCERERLLKCDTLSSFINDAYQVVDYDNKTYYKCAKSLGNLFYEWRKQSSAQLGNLLCATGQYALYMPNTCRYFTVASVTPLERSGQIELRFDDEDALCFVYCLLNSSFAYWHWRLYDGGITYPKGLLLKMPVFFDKLTFEDRDFFKIIAHQMTATQHKFLVTKNNIGTQENIKFPRRYRDAIDARLLDILGVAADPHIFDVVYANSAFADNSGSNASQNSTTSKLAEFYALPATKVVYDKRARKSLWKRTKSKELVNISEIRTICPALAHQIDKSYKSGQNIQAAVFSECAYAQTYANMLGLTEFIVCGHNSAALPGEVKRLLSERFMTPRYAYTNALRNKFLVQAGGCKSIDCALIDMAPLSIYTLEFKEPLAKTSEPDLPKYGEDGKLSNVADFLKKYPHFEAMLNEHIDMNFFDLIGKNEHAFSTQSINIAVSQNYLRKYADFICTEDKFGMFTIMPASDIAIWAEISGEIRSAGRNSLQVWSKTMCNACIAQLDGEICGSIVRVPLNKLYFRKERGGDDKISAYKLNPVLFVRVENCTVSDGFITFCYDDVRQLKPTIAGKIDFSNIEYSKMRSHYIVQ